MTNEVTNDPTGDRWPGDVLTVSPTARVTVTNARLDDAQAAVLRDQVSEVVLGAGVPAGDHGCWCDQVGDTGIWDVSWQWSGPARDEAARVAVAHLVENGRPQWRITRSI
ncbi:hypothetical protein KIH74_17330 [Kineosporia sp. J2-2]|uniref:Uncharacterized protein n=1 Tax=Kineosporia corallincola TaxID=2835133 RepID=A0ABS5TI39_9ACTN|nr:hypothetical protein [Kineosporia corallincola]MBT0770710.1 hypothetical protein [Kineosporia corallincola]